MKWIVEEIIASARLLASEGLVSTRAGNISYLFGEDLYITRTGASLYRLTPSDIIRLPFRGKTVLEERASSELVVHKRVLERTALRAVVHAHPLSAVCLSTATDRIIPEDSEGYLILGEVPVVAPKKVTASEDLAEAVSEALQSARAVVVRGHGAFSAGKTPLEATAYLSTLEHSCRILVCKNSEKG